MLVNVSADSANPVYVCLKEVQAVFRDADNGTTQVWFKGDSDLTVPNTSVEQVIDALRRSQNGY